MKTVLVAAVFALCSCADQAYSPAVSEAQVAGLLQTWAACFNRTVPQLDDRVSDARVIAEGVAAACTTDYHAWVDASAVQQLGSPDAQRMYRDLAEQPEHRVEQIIPAVLRYRAARAG